MIKSLFLNQKGKSNPTRKEHCTYSDAKSIGILYHADDFEEILLDPMIAQLKTDGKDVAIFGFKEKSDEEQLTFSKKDISGTGSIKSDSLSFFVNQPFDFLLCLDSSENINFKYVMALSKATCKIGFEAPQYHDLLQMSIKLDENKQKSVANILKYLKMI